MKLRGSDVTWREIDGELVILDLATSTYFTTNQTGTFLLRQLVEDRTHDDLVESLTEVFEVDPDTADRDVRDFVDLLRQRELLATASPEST